MQLAIDEQIQLTEFRRSDIDSLTEYLTDEDIYRCTLRIPRPYSRADAERWFTILDEKKKQDERILNWAIRRKGNLIGGIGLEPASGQPHRAEVGYWLAKPFWGQGIMTTVVAALCTYAFETLGLVKLTANVFSFNTSSARVLQKCGFEQEGYLPKHIVKDGKMIDSMVFGLLRV